MRTGIIYKATCKTTGKAYVGQMVHPLRNRRKRHEEDALQERLDGPFQRAIRKYGKADFIWIVVELKVPIEELDREEIAAIKEYETLCPKGYNLTSGGNTGGVWSEESRKKLVGRDHWIGRKHKRESKELMRIAKIGREQSPEANRKRSEALKGKKKNPETIEKLRLAARRQWSRKFEESCSAYVAAGRKIDLNFLFKA